MRASLGADGKLTVTPENGVESYALKQWMLQFSNLQSSTRPILSVGGEPDMPAPDPE